VAGIEHEHRLVERLALAFGHHAGLDVGGCQPPLAVARVEDVIAAVDLGEDGEEDARGDGSRIPAWF
jgi:hypothetical protein